MGPVVWAFRTKYIRDFALSNPGITINYSDDYYFWEQLKDIRHENLECLYCEECKSLAVFVREERYDFVPIDDFKNANPELAYYEEYIGMRQAEFKKFMVFCNGKSPNECLATYSFERKYYLSPKRDKIICVERDGSISAAWELVRHLYFNSYVLCEKVKSILRQKYLYWDSDVYTKREGLLPVVKIEPTEENDTIKVLYCRNLSGDDIITSAYYSSDSAEEIAAEIEKRMNSSEWAEEEALLKKK